MNVNISIEGKEAIPVRAIPLLTDWKILSPDACAEIFSGSDLFEYFEGMTAHRLNPDGSHQAVAQREWANWIAPKLAACNDSLPRDNPGHLKWRQEALALLPAGVFVWRDVFEAAHEREYGPNSKRARVNPDTFNPTDCELNYAPKHGPDDDWRNLVMEGFEPLIAPSGSRNLEHLWFVRGFYSASDNDAHWLGLKSLTPHEAAALLCGRDPLVQRGCDEQCVVLLERRLTDYNESHPARRSWREWHGVAKEIEAEYEKGFDALFAELAQTPNTSTAGAPAQPQAAPPAPMADSASNAKPWLSIDQQDPTPAQPWYTPARYFARQLAMENPALLANRKRLADRVATALFNAGFKKRGGKLRFESGTVLKALTNVTLG